MVDARVDDKANRAEEFGLEAAEIAFRIVVVESHFLRKVLGV